MTPIGSCEKSMGLSVQLVATPTEHQSPPPGSLHFPRDQESWLVGCGDYTSNRPALAEVWKIRLTTYLGKAKGVCPGMNSLSPHFFVAHHEGAVWFVGCKGLPKRLRPASPKGLQEAQVCRMTCCVTLLKSLNHSVPGGFQGAFVNSAGHWGRLPGGNDVSLGGVGRQRKRRDPWEQRPARLNLGATWGSCYKQPLLEGRWWEAGEKGRAERL